MFRVSGLIFAIIFQLTLAGPIPLSLNSITDGPCRAAPKLEMEDLDLDLVNDFEFSGK